MRAHARNVHVADDRSIRGTDRITGLDIVSATRMTTALGMLRTDGVVAGIGIRVDVLLDIHPIRIPNRDVVIAVTSRTDDRLVAIHVDTRIGKRISAAGRDIAARETVVAGLGIRVDILTDMGRVVVRDIKIIIRPPLPRVRRSGEREDEREGRENHEKFLHVYTPSFPVFPVRPARTSGRDLFRIQRSDHSHPPNRTLSRSTLSAFEGPARGAFRRSSPDHTKNRRKSGR